MNFFQLFPHKVNTLGQGAPNGTELQWKNDYSYWSKNVGTPTSAVRFVAGGWVQEFADSQGKVINIFSVKDGQQLTQGRPNRVQGAMLDIYRLTGGYERQNGGLGFATIAEEKSNFNGYKHYQSFDNGFIGVTTDNKIIIKNNQGQLINVIGYDGNAIHNTYRNTFSRVGGSSLGSPVSNVRAWGNGYAQEFAGGSDGKGAIMKSNANDNSYWVGGEFWNKLQEMGGATGVLSYPTSERYSTIGGAVRQDFLGGAIIKTSKGIFTLFGGIGSHYLKTEGGERGRLGLPTSGEVGIGNGVVVQNFEKGRIVWNDGSIRTEMPAYNDFGNPDQIITSWNATFYHWNGKGNPTYDEAQKIGTVKLGSNTRADGQFGMTQNWGSGSPARDVPTDFFAMKAHTRVGLTAGKTYEVWVRADDGYQIYAHKLNAPSGFNITRNALSGEWQPGAYGDYVKHRFTAQESGTFDFHLKMFEGGGDAYIDVILKDVTAASSNNIMTYDYFVNNWRSWSSYTNQNPFVNSYYDSNGNFRDGNCTWYAHGRMLQLGYSEYALDSMLGNAGTWDNSASRGCTVSYTPQVGSIAVWEAYVSGSGSVGHVAVVESVNADGTITISESNWGTRRRYNTRTIAANNPSKFIIVPKA